MKLLVTGGAGYLGSEICRQALAEGWDVLATQLVRPAPYGRAIRLDVRDEGDTARVFLRHGPDAVVHAAYRPAGPELDSAIVKASQSVAINAHRCGARLVHLSLDLVFDGEVGAPYAEDAEPRPVSAYGSAKAEAEVQVRTLHPEALIVRTSLLYGKVEQGLHEQGRRRSWRAASIEFYVDEIRCPTHAGELAAALLELVQTEVSGPLHVAAPEAISRYRARPPPARGCRSRSRFRPRRQEPGVGRARNVALDSGPAERLARHRLSGVREVLERR